MRVRESMSGISRNGDEITEAPVGWAMLCQSLERPGADVPTDWPPLARIGWAGLRPVVPFEAALYVCQLHVHVGVCQCNGPGVCGAVCVCVPDTCRSGA